MSARRVGGVVLLAVLFVHPLSLLAQTGGALRGVVVDQTGRPVADATVVVSSFSGERSTEIQTSGDGRYSLEGLTSGLYTVSAVKAELGGEVFRIRMRDGHTVAVNFELEPGQRVAAYLSEAGEREALSRLFASGIEANRSGQYELAIERFREALDVSPTCLECHFNLAIAYTELQQLVDAELEFQRVLVLRPDYAAAYYGLSGIYTRLGRDAEAAEARSAANRIALARIAAGRAGAEDAVSRGVTFLNAGNVADAIARFEAAIDQDASLGSAHYWLGVARQQSGRESQARAAFQRYLQLDPTGEFSDDTRQRLDALGR